MCVCKCKERDTNTNMCASISVLSVLRSMILDVYSRITDYMFAFTVKHSCSSSCLKS